MSQREAVKRYLSHSGTSHERVRGEEGESARGRRCSNVSSTHLGLSGTVWTDTSCILHKRLTCSSLRWITTKEAEVRLLISTFQSWPRAALESTFQDALLGDDRSRDPWFQLHGSRWLMAVHCLMLQMDGGDNWPKQGLYDRFVWWLMWDKTADGQHSLTPRFSPFIPAWAPTTASIQGSSKRENTGIFSASRHSLSPFVCEHNCSISSGFIPRYPLIKAQNGILATIVHQTHCVDSRHFSRELLESAGRNRQCNGSRVDKSACYENNTSKSIEKWNKQLRFQDVLQH